MLITGFRFDVSKIATVVSTAVLLLVPPAYLLWIDNCIEHILLGARPTSPFQCTDSTLIWRNKYEKDVIEGSRLRSQLPGCIPLNLWRSCV